jgi:hypothetical protein
MLVTRNYIKVNNEIYLVVRRLRNTTTDEQATLIHEELNTSELIRDSDGNWYCCHRIAEVEYREIDPNEILEVLEESNESEETQDISLKIKKKKNKDLSVYKKTDAAESEQTVDQLI